MGLGLSSGARRLLRQLVPSLRVVRAVISVCSYMAALVVFVVSWRRGVVVSWSGDARIPASVLVAFRTRPVPNRLRLSTGPCFRMAMTPARGTTIIEQLKFKPMSTHRIPVLLMSTAFCLSMYCPRPATQIRSLKLKALNPYRHTYQSVIPKSQT